MIYHVARVEFWSKWTISYCVLCLQRSSCNCHAESFHSFSVNFISRSLVSFIQFPFHRSHSIIPVLLFSRSARNGWIGRSQWIGFVGYSRWCDRWYNPITVHACGCNTHCVFIISIAGWFISTPRQVRPLLQGTREYSHGEVGIELGGLHQNCRHYCFCSGIHIVSIHCSIHIDISRYINYIRRPSSLPSKCDYYLFKEGQKPTWEQHMDGGEWCVQFNDVSRMNTTNVPFREAVSIHLPMCCWSSTSMHSGSIWQLQYLDVMNSKDGHTNWSVEWWHKRMQRETRWGEMGWINRHIQIKVWLRGVKHDDEAKLVGWALGEWIQWLITEKA